MTTTIPLWGRRIETTPGKAKFYLLVIVPALFALGLHASYRVISVVAHLTGLPFLVALALLTVALGWVNEMTNGVKTAELALLPKPARMLLGYVLMALTIVTLGRNGQPIACALVLASLVFGTLRFLMQRIWGGRSPDEPRTKPGKTLQRLRRTGRDVSDVDYKENS